MAELMKTIRGESGDKFIRSNRRDRENALLFICIWLIWGGSFASKIDDNPVAFILCAFARMPSSIFALWICGFGISCASIVWNFCGVTKISVSSDKLSVRHYLAKVAIYSSSPIKLSTIRNVSIDERKYVRKGHTWHRWVLIAHLDDGSTHEVAKFTNGLDADEFMSRYVR